jgi:hypothetical protein
MLQNHGNLYAGVMDQARSTRIFSRPTNRLVRTPEEVLSAAELALRAAINAVRVSLCCQH